MWKFYNSLVLRRFQGIRSLGIFALSVAFCLTGLLALSSCDDDDDEAEAQPIEMRGFYTSVNADGTTDCTNEDIDLREEDAGDLSEPNVRITARGVAFGSATFLQVGVKVGESDYNAETISTYYVSETDGNFDRPGAYFLVAKTDADIEADTIYTGYWAGYAYRRAADATAYQPVVICPYVMVPAGTAGLEDIGAGDCGEMGGDTVHPALAKYLTDDDGLRDCHNLLDSQGVLSPMKR
ncbi:MAG: hypothetical protein OXH71_00550 [Candidatus Dadabacteria bacterium]|nr:hypothetical protein [Candidatus Dadabacteria bacterium]MDE0519189.1 hypothetical protein [Candidatus Dadabacteria bacterium]MDE0662954.1 hypothetical protein [Candidatus Dadabacteria bacterium]